MHGIGTAKNTHINEFHGHMRIHDARNHDLHHTLISLEPQHMEGVVVPSG